MCMASLEKYRDVGLLLLRIGLGVMFIYHGAPKLFGGIEKWAQVGQAIATVKITFFPAFWGFMAAISEFGGGICLILGVLVQPAAALMFITMLIASLMHLTQGQGLATASHAIENAIVFLSLIFIGPGKYKLF